MMHDGWWLEWSKENVYVTREIWNLEGEDCTM